MFGQALKTNIHRQLEYGVMATLCLGCITTVVKYKLMTRKTIVEHGAVTQE